MYLECDMGKIPHVLFQTTKTNPLDDYIIDMIQQQLDDSWKYEHYNDEGIINFFKENPIDDLPDVINKFHSFKNGAHKADLFRYYYLYIKGGFYLDSDAMIYHSINDIVKEYEFVSVNSCMRWSVGTTESHFIFQGILGATPKHDIIKKALYNVYNTDPQIVEKHYMYFCEDLFNIVKTYTNKDTIKVYNEIYGGTDGDYTVDDNSTVLFKHYPKTKIIPSSIVGKIYTWGGGFITFKDTSKITTTWGNGNYKYLDLNTVEVYWSGFSHIVVFSNLNKEYASIRKGDLVCGKGTLLGSIDTTKNTETFYTKYGKISLYCNEVYILPSFKKPNYYWDIDTLLKLKQYIDPNKNMLEIGGHCGTSSVVYASFIKDDKCLHVYEPQKKMYKLLCKNVQQNNLTGKIIPHNSGVFCYNGTGKMNDIDMDGGGGVVEKRYNEESNIPCNFGGIGLGKAGENITLVTIDSMDLSDVGYIHCDAQGAENFIFSKGLETIKKYRPVIYYEDNYKHGPLLYKNVCDSYPEYKEESVFDIKKYCMETLNYSSYIDNFNGGDDTLLIP